MKIRIRAYRAIDDIESCEKHAEGHRRVLEVYGVSKVTSANLDWMTNPKTYVVQAESVSEGKVLGGARVQLAGEKPLPIEDAIADLDSNIYEMVKQLNIKGTGELCGLWNSREIAGLGIGSFFLTKAGVAICSQLEIGSLFGLAASYTIEMAQKVGFVIETSLGNNGTFYYPKEDFIATALLIKDPLTLLTADPIERENIFQLRNNPNQLVFEDGRKGKIEIDYQLKIFDN